MIVFINYIPKTMRILVFLGILFTSFNTFATAGKDSLLNKQAKHYFRTNISLNYYLRPEKRLISNRSWLNKSDPTYKFSQTMLSFYTPLYTWEKYCSDSIHKKNFHLLATGTLITAKPEMSLFNTTHKIYRGSLGLRGIYNTGYKGIWFVDIVPFFSQDNYTIKSPTIRLAAMVVYNRAISDNFSWRIGFARSYIFGDTYHLPVFGFRLGQLNKVNLSVNLPRNISLNVPLSEKAAFSLFLKPIGGVYNFKNTDTIFVNKSSVIQFRRSEFLSGISYNFNTSKNFSFFASSGISSTRNFSRTAGGIAFAENKSGLPKNNKAFIGAKLAPSLFFNVGICIKFGKVKNAYNDLNIANVKELNNDYGLGDTNQGNTDNNTKTRKASKVESLGMKDIQDLVNEQDLY